jgi:hypothetical protein
MPDECDGFSSGKSENDSASWRVTTGDWHYFRGPEQYRCLGVVASPNRYNAAHEFA